MNNKSASTKGAWIIGALGIPTYLTILALIMRYDIHGIFYFPIVFIYLYISSEHYLLNVHRKKYGKGSYALRSLFYQSIFIVIVILIFNFSS